MAKRYGKPKKGKKAQKRREQKDKLKDAKPIVNYYTIPFTHLHKKLTETGYDIKEPHIIRKEYWNNIPNGNYSGIAARSLQLKYREIVEEELKKQIESYSITYWLHAYRRLSPFSAGVDAQAPTIYFTRAAMEAAFQKYGQFNQCNRIAVSSEIEYKDVLDGLLVDLGIDAWKKSFNDKPEIVLTKFNLTELIELYEVEKLAYEMWRIGAELRGIGKGSWIVVDNGSLESVGEARDTDLDKLIKFYDSRLGVRDIVKTRRGTIAIPDKSKSGGILFLPNYNVNHIDMAPLFKGLYNTDMVTGFIPNFFWDSFDLDLFYYTNQYYEKSFVEYYGIELNYVLLILATLFFRLFDNWSNKGKWNDDGMKHCINNHYRAYDGPNTHVIIKKEILYYVQAAADSFDLGIGTVDETKIEKALEFWILNETSQEKIHVGYHNFHKIFLPFGEDRYFIDYAWIRRVLFELFGELTVKNENFKGDALEALVQGDQTILPTNELKSDNGTSKQVDATFSFDNRIIIVECKSIQTSLGFEAGAPEAIEYRKKAINEALKQVDEKATWLRDNPKGTNYDVSNYEEILPIVVSPFVEFIPSYEEKYWVAADIPRVLTPGELKSKIEDGSLLGTTMNIVKIKE